MSDYYYSQFRFTGNEDQLKDFYNKIRDIFNARFEAIDDRSGYVFSWNITEFKHGKAKLNFTGGVCSFSDNDDYIMISKYGPWNNDNIIWTSIIKEYYDDISFVFILENHKTNVYINTDKEGKFYKQKYACNIHINDNDGINNTYFVESSILNTQDDFSHHLYFNTDDELIDRFNEMLGRTFQSIEELFKCLEENFNSNNAISINLYKYSSDFNQ